MLDKYKDGVQQIWDQTSLNGALCLKKYKFEKVDGWRSKYDSIPAAFGTFAHETYEEYDKVVAMGGDSREAVDVAVKYALENGEFLNEFNEPQWSLPSLLRDIVWYGEQFRDDMFPLALDQDGNPLIEIRFEVPIGIPERRFSGRIDKIVMEGDELIVVDRKFTKATLTNYYFDAYIPSIQLTAYIWATRKILGLPVSKAMIEAHQVGVTLNRCERRSFIVTDDRLDDFEEELIHMVDRVDAAHDKDKWPRDLRVCNMYGGCAFKNICSQPKKHEEFLLGEYFDRR